MNRAIINNYCKAVLNIKKEDWSFNMLCVELLLWKWNGKRNFYKYNDIFSYF